VGGFNYYITENDCGGRVDNFLVQSLGNITRSQISNAIKNGSITVNNNNVKSGYILRTGDRIAGKIDVAPITAQPEKMDLDIVYEDPHLMIINKPRGMVIHTGAGVKSGTLLNGLIWRQIAQPNPTAPPPIQPNPTAPPPPLSPTDIVTEPYANNLECAGIVQHPINGVGELHRAGIVQHPIDGVGELHRAGIVHRLDKNTAGLVIVAKTAEAQAKLGAMFEKHEIKRTYLALVEGVVKGDMTIDKNIIRHKTVRTLFTTAAAGGRRAVTHLTVLEQYKKHTLCEFVLETGRTHQIRVHCKSINHPIVGDPEYNPNGTMKNLNGQMLSAVKLEFCHPITKKDIKIEINASKQLTDTIKKCKNIGK
jgi:23S rRNA pseudouridine1911/1915/1917 synthase